jgi:hypothetical protein
MATAAWAMGRTRLTTHHRCRWAVKPAAAWLEQLAVGGRLVAPVHDGRGQVLVVVDRAGGRSWPGRTATGGGCAGRTSVPAAAGSRS